MQNGSGFNLAPRTTLISQPIIHEPWLGSAWVRTSRLSWIDAEVQKLTNAKRQRIQFGSKDYFDFTANHPRALAWLALGQNVQFVLDRCGSAKTDQCKTAADSIWLQGLL